MQSYRNLKTIMDKASSFQYFNVPGFFLQDELSTDPTSFDYVIMYVLLNDRVGRLIYVQAAWDFGLIKRTYDSDEDYDPKQTKTQWERFDQLVSKLNSETTSRFQYKVLYLVRAKSPANKRTLK